MKQNKEKSTKIILGISIIIMLIMAAAFGYSCKSASAKKTSLQICLSIGVAKSWWSKEPPKDSAFIDKCERYHREILIDKYGGKLSLQSKLLYIETGQSPAQVVYIKEIIKFIFQKSKNNITKAEDKFRKKLNNGRRPGEYNLFSDRSVMDWMAQGIYMGIKFAEKEMKRREK